MMSAHPFIAIEGVIGVGKTTLARMLQPDFGGAVFLEEFEENPFLSDFYSDRSRYAFQTQIFFLLSRYRQQTATIPQALKKGSVLSDYTFAKDSLFAQINLTGDELMMYRRVFSALDEKMPKPDLLVFLRADLDTLMKRIAARDRPYERDMDPDYIDQLRIAYDDFTKSYEEAPVLVIDSNELDFVQNPADLEYISSRIKSTLEFGTYQTQLPGVEAASTELLEQLENGTHSLTDFQHFHLSLDEHKGFEQNTFFNFLALTEEIGEIAQVLAKTWKLEQQHRINGKSESEAHNLALTKFRTPLQNELADGLAYILKLSNYAGIDLEQAYLHKMVVNTQRDWQPSANPSIKPPSQSHQEDV